MGSRKARKAVYAVMAKLKMRNVLLLGKIARVRTV